VGQLTPKTSDTTAVRKHEARKIWLTTLLVISGLAIFLLVGLSYLNRIFQT
jgi:hypothetical protein